jgi:hypothetical protein
LGLRGTGKRGSGEDYITRNLMICTDLNSVLRGIFGSKRDGVTGEWRRIHNEELNDLY